MKTAVSIPDPLFQKADRYAKLRRISRSQLIAIALDAYLRQHAAAAIKAALDEVYATESLNSVLDSRLRKPGCCEMKTGDGAAELWWASLPIPQGSGPGCRRAVLVAQAARNESAIRRFVCAAITGKRSMALGEQR